MNKRKNNIELDIMKAFDGASVEDMDELLRDINPESFECPNDFTKRRIKKQTLNRIEGKKTRKSRRILKAALSTAAALAIMASTVFTFNAEARELVKKLFSFVPSQGIVEVESEGMPYYILSEDVVRAEADDISMEVTRLTVDAKELTLEYKVNLKNVDVEKYDSYAYEVDPPKEREKYYKELGYDKYFDILPMMEARSSITLGKDVLSRQKTETYFSDVANGKYLTIVETYLLGAVKPADMQGAVLMLGDLALEFSLVEADMYDSMAGALRDQIICVRDGISIVCEQKRVDDELQVSFYVVDTGKYSQVPDLFPYFFDEDAGAYIIIDGNRIEGQLASTNEEQNTMIFNMTGYDKDTPCEVHIPKILVRNDEEITINLSQQVVELEDYNLMPAGVLPFDEAIEKYYPMNDTKAKGSFVMFAVDEKSMDENKHFLWYDTCNGMSMEYINEDNVRFGGYIDDKNPNEVTLSGETFMLESDFVFYINRESVATE